MRLSKTFNLTSRHIAVVAPARRCKARSQSGDVLTFGTYTLGGTRVGHQMAWAHFKDSRRKRRTSGIPFCMARHVVQVANVSAGMGLFEGLQMEQVQIALWQDYFVGRSTLLCLGSWESWSLSPKKCLTLGILGFDNGGYWDTILYDAGRETDEAININKLWKHTDSGAYVYVRSICIDDWMTSQAWDFYGYWTRRGRSSDWDQHLVNRICTRLSHNSIFQECPTGVFLPLEWHVARVS